MIIRKKFGQNICELRTRLDLTQEQLCEAADIDRSYLQRIEKGTSSPSLDVIVKLRHALRCSWAELTKGLD